MTKLYTDADLWDAHRQRSHILTGFYVVTSVCLAALVALYTWYIMLPYKDLSGQRPPVSIWIIVIASVIMAAYLFFVFPYMGICFKRCNAYYRTLRFISIGLKEYTVAPFAGIEDWTTRDGVDVNVATFFIRNVKREEEMLRQIYVDGEKDFPPFEEGERVRLVTQGNLLIEYEILPKEESETHGTDQTC